MSDHNGYADQLQINKEQYEIKTKQPEQENQQENITKLQMENQQATRQKINNSALGNTDAIPQEQVMSSKALEKVLSENDGDEETTVPKEEALNLVESILTVPVVSEIINRPAYQTSKTLMDAKQGQKVKLADDTKVLEKAAEIEATQEAEAQERLEKQPEELKKNYQELLDFMKEFRDSCLKETNKENSDLMNNVIKEVTDFETLVTSKEFSIGKQHGYIPQLVTMRNAVALYYEKNKGFKWTSKGRRRRELTKNILNKLNDWIGNMPDPILDDYVVEMEKDENEQMRDLPSSKEMYMSLGSAVLKKQLDREGNEMSDAEIKGYLNPDTVRYISMARSYWASFDKIHSFSPDQAEKDALRKQAAKKNGKPRELDSRAYGYQWGSVKYNFDGTPANDQEAEKSEKIKESMKGWYSDDLEKMKPFFDEYVKSIIDFKMPVNDITPEFLHKKGPALSAFADYIISIQNMFESQGENKSLATEYFETLPASIRYRIKMIADSTFSISAISMFARNQQLNSLNKFKSSAEWQKPADINKSKPLIDLLKKSPQKARDIEVIWEENVEEEEIKYFNGKTKGPIQVFQSNYFEQELVEKTVRSTIVGDYYDADNVHARRTVRANMFIKDVPTFNLEHPELDGPICAIYQKLEDIEEKIAGVVSEMKAQNDQEEQRKMNNMKEALEVQRELLMREKDSIVEERTKNPNSPYTAYAHEAKQESAKLGFPVSPEAVAYKKASELSSNFVKQIKQMDFYQEVSEHFKDYSGGELNRAYEGQLRYVNLKDGQPVTEEDKKNLEWNKAYGKAIVEDNQEDRIRLIKEQVSYIAETILTVDFDRLFDMSYWIENPRLYVTFKNFILNGMEAAPPCRIAADEKILREYFAETTPTMQFVQSFFDFFKFFNAGSEQFAIAAGYHPMAHKYRRPKVDSSVALLKESIMENFGALKENMEKYKASKNQ